MNNGFNMNLIKVMTLLFGVTMLWSCSDDGDDTDALSGDWKEISDYAGDARSGAVAVVVGDVAYVGLGFNSEREYLNDFWAYDASLNNWTAIADLPAVGRTKAAGFALDGKMYVGTGFNGDLATGEQYMKDFWSYDPATDQWSAIDSLPGEPRRGAVVFTLDDKGYVGTGFGGSSLLDFHAYDGSNWVEAVDIGGKRENGFAFIVDGVAYVGGGISNGLTETDFFKFGASTNSLWLRLQDLDEDLNNNASRSNTVAFSVGSKGYVTTGTTSTLNTATTFEYDASNDSWIEKTAFEGVPRNGAVAFMIGDRAFVGLGNSGSDRFDDFWEFFPNESPED